jgi:hypothetical protein
VGIFERGLALARQCGSPEALARAEYWLGYLHYARGNARAAQPHCEAALALAQQQGDMRLVAQVLATLGQVLATTCDYDGALPLFDAAIDSKRQQSRPGSGIAVGSAYALACKGSVLGDRGRFDQADECFAEAMQLLGDGLHQVASSVRNWISAVWQWQGRWDEAAEMSDAALRVAECVKSRQLVAMSRALRGHALWMLHGHEEDVQAMRDATSWIEVRKGGLVTSLNHGHLVEANIALGRRDEARHHAARLFHRARQHDRLGEAIGCRALARAAAAERDFARAEHCLLRAEQAAAARGSAHERATNALCRATLALARGETPAARSLLDMASSGFNAMGMRWHLAQARELARQL